LRRRRRSRRTATANTATWTSSSTAPSAPSSRSRSAPARSNYEPIRRILGTTIKSVEKRYDRKQLVTGVPSGYHKLDAMTAGFQPSELIIIAARPSMGKTALVMNAVQNAAIELGIPALVFSLEMSKEALVERMLCSESRVDSQRLRGGFLDQRDWISITKGASRVSEAPIWIDDAGAPSLLELRAKARRWRSDNNIFKAPDQLGIIVIDYLQLIAGRPSSGRDRTASARCRRSAAA
jgi:replicative DNA helicase